jgi:flagellar biosynthesis protein FlhF
MKLKSYFAVSVEAAMNLAAQELGPDAMLVHSRRAGAEMEHAGEYEVVFAAGPEISTSRAHKDSGRRPNGQTATEPAGAGQPSLDRLSEQLGELKKQIERIAGCLQRSLWFARTPAGIDCQGAECWQSLMTAEVDPVLAHELIARLSSRRESTAALSLDSELERELRVDATLGKAGAQQRIAAFAGPPGAGKTTTLVKLAARYGLVGRRPAQILSTDVFRIAATEQLRACAAILGIGFQTAETTHALDQLLEEHRGKELILIDTPGFGLADSEEASELAEFLSSRGDIDTHLVLPATLRTADLGRIADRYEAFGPAKLLFTRIDETDCFGPILNLVVRTGKAVSFLSNGQRIPEDLEPAAKQTLIRLMLGRPDLPDTPSREPNGWQTDKCEVAAA